MSSGFSRSLASQDPPSVRYGGNASSSAASLSRAPSSYQTPIAAFGSQEPPSIRYGANDAFAPSGYGTRAPSGYQAPSAPLRSQDPPAIQYGPNDAFAPSRSGLRATSSYQAPSAAFTGTSAGVGQTQRSGSVNLNASTAQIESEILQQMTSGMAATSMTGVTPSSVSASREGLVSFNEPRGTSYAPPSASAKSIRAPPIGTPEYEAELDKSAYRYTQARNLAAHGDEEAAIILFKLRNRVTDTVAESELLEYALIDKKDQLSAFMIDSGRSVGAVLDRIIARGDVKGFSATLFSLRHIGYNLKLSHLMPHLLKANQQILDAYADSLQVSDRNAVLRHAIQFEVYGLVDKLLRLGVPRPIEAFLEDAVRIDTDVPKPNGARPMLDVILFNLPKDYRMPRQYFDRFVAAEPGFAEYARSRGLLPEAR